MLLLLAAVVAVLIANSPLHDAYLAALAFQLGPLTVSSWINDGLMAFFFFNVGLEIKSELMDGDLSSRERALLPAIGAFGGMVVPVAIYLFFERDRGWGVPMATDIAFAVAVLQLFNVRSSLKTFLLALAIVDDLGAVFVIAFFYTSQIHVMALAAAAFAALSCYFLQSRKALFTICAVACWWLVHESGVHATIAGVVLGLLIRDPRAWHQKLHGLSTYLVMPLFALANAGLTVSDFFVTTPLVNAIELGLFIGKPVGIFTSCWLAVRTGFAHMAFSLRELFAAACLGGIGFTMSIFVATLAFGGEKLELAKLGIVRGSLLSAVLGAGLLWMTKATLRSAPHRSSP